MVQEVRSEVRSFLRKVSIGIMLLLWESIRIEVRRALCCCSMWEELWIWDIAW